MKALPVTLPDRDGWLAERKRGLGASDAPVLLGLSPWKSPLQLYCEKLDLIPPDSRETEAMEWGLLLEGPIGERYAEKTRRAIQRPVPFTIYRTDAPEWMGATFDAFTDDASRGGAGIVEIKNVGVQRANEWDEEPPLMYQVQLQWQLRVSGYAWGSLAALIGGQRFIWFDLERNDRFIAVLEERAVAFWDRIQKQAPPAIDGTLSGREVLAALYPTAEPGKAIPLPAAAIAWDRQRLEAEEQMKRAKSLKDEAENRLKQAIGDAEIGVLADGVTYSWRTVERRGYEVKPTSYRELRRKAIR